MSKSGKLGVDAVIDTGPIGGVQYVVILLCALVAIIDGFDTQSIAFAAPEIVRAWHVAPASFGSVFAAVHVGGLIGAIGFGIIGDRIGRKPSVLYTVLLFAIATLLTPFVTSIGGLVGARFITGVGLGGAGPGIVALTSEYAPEKRRATFVTVMFCGIPLGSVIGGVVSARLIPEFGWPSLFYLGAIVPMLLIPAFWLWVPESIRFLALRGDKASIDRILERMGRLSRWSGAMEVSRRDTLSPVTRLFTEGRALGTALIWVTFFFSLLLTYFLMSWIPMIARLNGLSIGAAVMAVSSVSAGTIMGCIFIGRLADRFNPAIVIAIGYTLGTAAVLAIGQAGSSVPLLFAITFAAGFCCVGSQLCLVALGAIFYETSLRATGTGWSAGISRLGSIAGPMLGGLLIAQGFSGFSLFTFAGASSLCAGLAMFAMGALVLRKPARHRGNIRSAPDRLGQSKPEATTVN